MSMGAAAGLETARETKPPRNARPCCAGHQPFERTASARLVMWSKSTRPHLKPPNAAGNRLARQGQSELTGLLGPGSEAR
jgi:hypothetical protein